MKRLICFAVCILGLCLPGRSEITLGQWSTSAGATDQVSRGTVIVTLSIGNGCYFGGACTDFFSQTLTPSNVGTTFDINASNLTAFSTVAALLTNNQPDYVWVNGTALNGSGGGNGDYEAKRFGLSTTDFSGNTIQDITVLVTGYQDIPANQYNLYSFTVTVEGTPGVVTPEPSTAGLLLAAAGVGLVSYRRLFTRPSAHPSECVAVCWPAK